MKEGGHLVNSGQVSQVPVHQTAAGLGFADVDQVILQRIVEVIRADDLTLQQATLNPAHLTAALLVHQQPRAENLGLDFEETGELLQVHGRVELEVRPDGRIVQGVLDLVHENSGVVVDRVDVKSRVVKVRRSGADELGASGAEELLEQRKGIGTAVLETKELLAVLLTQSRVDSVVQTSGVKSHADRDQSIHLVVLLSNGIIAVATLLEVLCPRDIDQNVTKHADGVAVTTHHHVRETHIVVSGEVGCHDTSEHGLLVHLNIIKGLESKAEISQQAMDTQQTDDREVSQHLIQRAGAIFTSECQRILSAFDSSQLFVNLRFLDERVKNVEDRVAAPCVRVLAQELCLLFVGAAAGDTVTVAAERFKLVDEFIDHIPGPVVLCE